MNTKRLLRSGFVLAAIVLAVPFRSKAQIYTIDSFTTNTETTSSHVTRSADILGGVRLMREGAENNQLWRTVSNGQLLYHDGQGVGQMELHYWPDMDITKGGSSTAVVLDIPKIQGDWYLQFGTYSFSGSGQSWWAGHVSTPGQLVVPFSAFNNSVYLKDTYEMYFMFIAPRGTGGEITLNDLVVVPEPSPLVLLASIPLLWVARTVKANARSRSKP